MKTLLVPSRAIDHQVHAALDRAWPEEPRLDGPLYSSRLVEAVEGLETWIEAHPTYGFLMMGPDPIPHGRYVCTMGQLSGPEAECEGASIALAICGALIEAREIAEGKAA